MSLAESTLIRFIDQIGGTNTDSIYDELAEDRSRIKELCRGDNSAESRREVRRLYERIDDILLIPEYLLLVVDSPKDYRRAVKGISLNGKTYHRLLATSAGVKTSTIVFIADEAKNGATLIDELRRRINNGRDENKPMVPAKLEAYMGLTCSASKVVSDPRKVLVVNDCESTFRTDYILLDDAADGEPVMTTIKDGEVTITASDGCGMISPMLLAAWSEELGEHTTVGGVCSRCAFWKGMLFPFDFYEFAEKIAGTYLVKDVWGEEHDIRDVDIVAPVSMLKLWDSYESWDDYWQNCKANGYYFSITKTVEPNAKESRELNYQYLSDIKMSDEDIRALIAPTMEDIRGVMGGDAAKAILYLKGVEQTERSALNSQNDYVKALMVSDQCINDPYIRQRISQTIRYRADRAKLGRIRSRGDYMVASGDLFALCQAVFGLEIHGLLRKGEIFSNYWYDRSVTKVALMRSPMLSENNICIRKSVCEPEVQYWYRYMKNVIVLNAHDNTMSALCGCDFDGDTLYSTDNEIILRNVVEHLTIECAQRKAEKVIPTEADYVEANIATFGNEVGSCTNICSSLFPIRDSFPEDSEEYKTAHYRIQCCQQYQQNAIKGRLAQRCVMQNSVNSEI